MKRGELTYWRYKGDKPWNKDKLFYLGDGLVEIWSEVYYQSSPLILSYADIEIKQVRSL